MKATVFPTIDDVLAAQRRISPVVRRTPLIESERLSAVWGDKVYLKLENLQLTGTFKARGALNKILSLSDDEKRRGLIAFSTGNHGLATAYLGRSLSIPVVICLSERVPAFRLEAMRALGAEVVAHGQSQDEAYLKALELIKDRGLTMVAPFDDFEVICGQGTIALEIFEELPKASVLAVPLSGGGLFSGVAMVAKSKNPAIKTLGVSMAVAPAMIRSLQAGKPVEIPEADSLADALLGGIGLDNRYTFRMTKAHLDGFVEVTEAEIARAMAGALLFDKQVVEGSGAVGLAALEAGKITGPGPLVIVISGGNARMDNLLNLAREYNQTHGS
ncbi:MAG: pyridoxal-phosphate dependent enzyme [Deltaproteobacteria bacterium]|jgi:threonine dehydratase|nr:pyridoxal-phosphate dependent enzyme [Deltaproteobacteria bacterium]